MQQLHLCTKKTRLVSKRESEIISGISRKNSPLVSNGCETRGGIFTKNPTISPSQIPNFFSPAAGFRSLFWGFSRFVARRRRKILPFYTSETRFPLRKSMFLLPKYPNFRLRRNLSDRSQMVAKQGREFLRRGEFLLEIPLML